VCALIALMCVCVFICMHVCVSVCVMHECVVCMCVCVCVCLICVIGVYVYVCVYVIVCVWVYMYVCIMLICVHVYVCVCISSCMYVACYSNTNPLVRFGPDPDSCSLWSRYTGDLKTDPCGDSEIRTGSCNEDRTVIRSKIMSFHVRVYSYVISLYTVASRRSCIYVLFHMIV